jgi:mycobactin lysine-N-oxygenase
MSIRGDGIVITGPGPARTVGGQPAKHPRVFDGKTFWQRIADFENVPLNEEPIGIIGSGETAASVIVALARILRNPVPIVVVNRQGAIFSRGEGFWENHLYTDPEEWTLLSRQERAEIIHRTDRGVFSQGAMTFINQLRNVIHRRMTDATIEIANDHELEIEGRPVLVDGGKVRIPVFYAIVATGFDPWWFVKRFSDVTLQALMTHSDQREVLLGNIGPDLAFANDRVPTPKLHVPMLAGLAQGPGFPNLSCLGHVADRILSSYVSGHPS